MLIPRSRTGAVLVITVLAAVAAAALYPAWQHRGCALTSVCTRVLFIGDSFTSVNDLPFTFEQLAESGGEATGTGIDAPGGATLADHAANPSTATEVSSQPWDYVLLQEQSQVPASPALRERQMYPAARTLVDLIRGRRATPILFATWAHRGGWPEAGLPGYLSMQSALDQGYAEIAQRVGVSVAPVGAAWRGATGQGPDLYQADGVHPSAAGTYLAACVIYQAIFNRTPVGLAFHGGLGNGDALRLQEAALTES
ncbi:MAG: SGNH/GDSL hydrolase family protein [Candidatus Dormibacteria bacterium]